MGIFSGWGWCVRCRKETRYRRSVAGGVLTLAGILGALVTGMSCGVLLYVAFFSGPLVLVAVWGMLAPAQEWLAFEPECPDCGCVLSQKRAALRPQASPLAMRTEM